MASVPMSCFVDTNVLVHAIDDRSTSKRVRAAHWLRELGLREALLLSPQSLCRLSSVFVGRPAT